MTTATSAPIKVFQFPRMFEVPNLSPFCAKLETWLRIAAIPYEVVDTPDPRKGPRGQLPYIEDGGTIVADTSLIIEHLIETRGVDPDARLDSTQRATARLVQRALEGHYTFVLAYTHLYRDEGLRHTRARFDPIPAIVRPFVARAVKGQIRKILWHQGVLRGPDDQIMKAAIRDWDAVISLMSDGPFFFGAEPTSLDAIVFATLASTILTPIESPIRGHLSSQPAVVAYAERVRGRLFPELVRPPNREPSRSS